VLGRKRELGCGVLRESLGRGEEKQARGKGKLGLGQQAIRPRRANQAFGPDPGRLSRFFFFLNFFYILFSKALLK
jgi:hypothetical protein